MKTTVLLTGATGFLGSHMRKKLDGDIYHVVAVSKETMDLLDGHAVDKVISEVRPDIVIHLGGLVDLRRDTAVAKACIDANIIGTLHVVDALKKNPPKLFVYASTEEVYGDAPLPYSEEMRPSPPSPYAMTKLAGEELCQMYGGYGEFPVIVLRLATMYGPGETEKRFIPSVIVKALKNEEILLNSGKKMRDYLYIDDAVDAVMACLNRPTSSGSQIINVGGGTAYTLDSVVEKIIQVCHSNSIVRYGVLPERPLEAAKWLMDIQKAKRLVDWQPKTTIEKGIGATVSHFTSRFH